MANPISTTYYAFFDRTFYTEKNKDKNECGICLEKLFKNSDSKQAYVQGHIQHGIIHAFHEECITPWIKRSNQCPECKVALSDSKTLPYFLGKLPSSLENKTISILSAAVSGIATSIGLLSTVNSLALTSIATIGLSFAAIVISIGVGYLTAQAVDKFC